MKFKILFAFLFIFSLVTAQTNEESDINLLKKLTLEEIDYSLRANTALGLYLLGIACEGSSPWTECQSYLFKNFGGSWTNKFESEPFYALHGEIEGLVFQDGMFYYGSLSAGGSSGNGSYNFNVFDPKSDNFYSLEYFWSDFKYSEHGFINLDEIDNAEVLNFIEKKVSNSEHIHRPENNLTLADHWKIDNKNIYESVIENTQTLNFHFSKDVEIYTEKIEVENNDYIIYNFFKGNMYGFKKSTKEYFLIWIPSWSYGTVTNVKFILNNNLQFEDSHLGDNGALITINLDTQEILGFSNN